MNIKVVDLKRFQKLSAHIRPAGITPASSCIKFGGGAMIKNANSAFISYDCPDATEEVLVNENVLNSVLSNTVSDFINISEKGGKLILSDTRDTIPCGIIPYKEFHDPTFDDSKRKPISGEFLDALRRAAGTCMPYKQTPNLYMFVHVGNKMITAGNGFMGVTFPIVEDYTMVLEKSIALLVSGNDITASSETQGHYFFYSDKFVMGFSKQEIGFCDMGKKMQGGDKLTFSVSSSDISSFNSLALSLCKDWSIVTMDTGKFEMVDHRIDSAPTRPMPQLKLTEPFHYNAENMNQIISAMGVDALDFYHSDNAYFIKSTETKASAIIAKMSR